MTTLSVPISSKTEAFIKREIREGRSENKAQVVRRALLRLEEEEAVEAVLRAEKEPLLRGNLDELAKRI